MTRPTEYGSGGLDMTLLNNVSDLDLVQDLRAGKNDSAEELLSRYQHRALHVAKRVLGDSVEVENVVSEAFTRVFEAIRRGGGPTEFFGAYVSKTVLHLSYEYAKIRNELHDNEERLNALPDSTWLNYHDEQVEASIVSSAFQSLPQRWKRVLWYSDLTCTSDC